MTELLNVLAHPYITPLFFTALFFSELGGALSRIIIAPMRKPVLYLLLCLAIDLITGAYRPAIQSNVVVWIVLMTFSYLIMPMLFWKLTTAQKFAAAIAAFVLMTGVDVIQSGTWVVLSGGMGPLDEAGMNRMPELAFFINLLGLVLRLGGAYLLRIPLARLRSSDPEPGSMPIRLALMPLLNCTLWMVICLSMILNSKWQHVSGSTLTAYFVFNIACACVALLTTVAFTVLLWRDWRAQRARERADALQQQVETQLDAYRSAMDGLQGTAKLRHDYANHLATLSALVERGKLEAAARYAHDLHEELVS